MLSGADVTSMRSQYKPFVVLADYKESKTTMDKVLVFFVLPSCFHHEYDDKYEISVSSCGWYIRMDLKWPPCV